MTPDAVGIIRERLKHYADQGVFQGLGESPGRLEKTTFRFRWLLGHEFQLVFDPKKQALAVKDLLPSMETYGFIDSDLRSFVANRIDSSLPEHRRLDTDRVKLTYSNRKQAVSLVMEVGENQYEYAIKALFTTLNDLFAHLHLYHIGYLQDHFGVPEE